MKIKLLVPVLALGGVLVSCSSPPPPPIPIVEEHNVTVVTPKAKPKKKVIKKYRPAPSRPKYRAPAAEDFRAVTTPG